MIRCPICKAGFTPGGYWGAQISRYPAFDPDPDPDIPNLTEAKAEYSKLQWQSDDLPTVPDLPAQELSTNAIKRNEMVRRLIHLLGK